MPLTTLLATPIDAALADTNSEVKAFLGDLQANILKSHGRDHSAHMFISFAGMASADIASVLRSLAAHCTSAEEQLKTSATQALRMDGGTVRCLFLSAHGYAMLGGLAVVPTGTAFASGMAARGSVLADPPATDWQPEGWRAGQAPVDAMFLVADRSPLAVTQDLEQVEQWLGGTGATLLVVERGLQQRKLFTPGAKALPVEHFGYVDGRSQPLFLASSLTDELQNAGGELWSPAFPPSQFIVADPNGRNPLAAGSYFVFRKLEQNVRGFKQAEQALADKLGLVGGDRERAGAMVVGRFEDGTPVVLNQNARALPPPNNFNYSIDSNGLKCPFHAHIRKTNPRGDITRAVPVPESAERNPIMARRGVTYGERPMLDDRSDFADDRQEPVADVGLLFMAYMASIEAQFEFTQNSWANNPKFAGNLNSSIERPATGIDPVIGQSTDASTKTHSYQDGWNAGAQPRNFAFSDFVKMIGGEYLFAPSLSFLRTLGI